MASYTKTYTIDFTSTGDTLYTGIDKLEDNEDSLITIVNNLKKNYAAATAPSSPLPDEGQVWYNTTTNMPWFYDGAAWYSPGYFKADNTSVASSGTGEDVLITTDIAAGTMGATGGLRIIVAGTKTNSNGNKTVKFYFGSTALTINAAANDVTDWRGEIYVVNTAVAVQRITWVGINGTTLVQGYDTATENTASAVTIKCTGECAHASDIITQTMLLYQRIL